MNEVHAVGYYKAYEHSGYLTANDSYSGIGSYHSLTTEKIKCKQGDVFRYKGVAAGSAVSMIAYDISGEIVDSVQINTETFYIITISQNVASVKFSSYAHIDNEILFEVTNANSFYEKSIDAIAISKEPLTNLPEYFLGNLSYKPLGKLKKPYICFITDDGHIDMNNRTIPLALSKEIPFTFAIAKDSDVMSTPENIAIVKNAIANGGCSVAQHAMGINWNDKTETELNAFFDEEAAFFEANGIEVKGAVVPSHFNTPLVAALCGGRFGVVRSGYEGYDLPTIHDEYYTCCPRTSLYNLSSFNFRNYSLENNKLAIDYSIENNYLLCIYMHENGLTEAEWQQLADVIDYAKSRPITFITLGDILTSDVI